MNEIENIEKIYTILDEIFDPEIPVVTIRDMGMLREVFFEDSLLNVIITPTYTGCPAMYEIENDIYKKLQINGFENVKVVTRLTPAWTTDWMTPSTHIKLKEYGIAPPVGKADTSLFPILKKEMPLICPFCESDNTNLTSQFGTTACKSLHYCNSCRQPFEHFKCH